MYIYIYTHIKIDEVLAHLAVQDLVEGRLVEDPELRVVAGDLQQCKYIQLDMYIYIYMYTHIHMYIYIYICTHVCI